MSDQITSPTRRYLLGGATLGALLPSAAAAQDGARARGGASSRDQGAFVSDFALSSDAGDATPALRRAFDEVSASRTSPPRHPQWGTDVIRLPRGTFDLRSPLVWGNSQLGFGLIGNAAYASTITTDIARGAAISLKTYVAVRFQDFLLTNRAAAPGESVAFDLDPTGGGGDLTFKRIIIEGFGTGIRNNGEGNTPGNGDKTLVEQVSFGTLVGYDNTRNKQAVGWTFLNCASGCARATFRLGGAGETAIINHAGDVYGAFIELPEGSGNAGSGARNYFGSRTTVSSSKLEYHGGGDRMLLDARRSLEVTDNGGSNCDIVFRETSIASGSAWPDPASHTIIQVGDETRGSDAIRVKQVGGTIEGVIKVGSAQMGALNRRWSFRDAVRAPDPATVRLLGRGNHVLMEWRANENVPVDQYRGGEAFTGAIDAQKAYLWRHIGAALLNTGVAAAALGGRVGLDAVIDAFPDGTAQTGLAVYLDRALDGGTDLEVTQYTDARFAVRVGTALALPGGSAKGLHRVHDSWRNLGDGRLFVRITTNGPGKIILGALVPLYFPYMGS